MIKEPESLSSQNQNWSFSQHYHHKQCNAFSFSGIKCIYKESVKVYIYIYHYTVHFNKRLEYALIFFMHLFVNYCYYHYEIIFVVQTDSSHGGWTPPGVSVLHKCSSQELFFAIDDVCRIDDGGGGGYVLLNKWCTSK